MPQLLKANPAPVQEKTSPENLIRINKMCSALQETFENLYYRWQDEKEYEDIKDYGEVIKKALPEGFPFLQMNKRPFSFDFQIGTPAVYQMFIKGRNLGWPRLK
jgi:hypothetical protein